MKHFGLFREEMQNDESDHISWSDNDVDFDPSSITEKNIKPGSYDAPVHEDPKMTHYGHEDSFVQHAATFTPEHLRQIGRYKYRFDTEFNGLIRKNKGDLDKTVKTQAKIGLKPLSVVRSKFDHLDHVTSHVTSSDIAGYRGTEHLDMTKMKPGQRFTDHGYTGISRDPGIARDYSSPETEEDTGHTHIFKVHVPAGSRGYHLDRHDDEKLNPKWHEHEFLLSRGSTFEVTHHSRGEYEGQKYHVVHVKVVGQRS
jgi:hypothetical protein